MAALTKLQKWILKFEETNGSPTISEVKAQIEMLKEMEKQQIEDAYLQGFAECDATGIMDCEQYYNETFNK